jgi:SAM-dependent methyltransferase
MIFSLSTLFYRIFIDPILSSLHRSVLVFVKPGQRVLDVACGTGTLAMTMARRARHVTGIDLSEESIASAQRMARRRRLENVAFDIRDAGDLSCYADKEFDLAVTSMAVHQFDAGLAIKVLVEMKRIAKKIIITDYNHHMPPGWGRSVAWGIERLAGGEHYRNFRIYMQLGGIHYFNRQAEIKIISEETRNGGVFVVMLGEGKPPH